MRHSQISRQLFLPLLALVTPHSLYKGDGGVSSVYSEQKYRWAVTTRE